MVKQKTSPDELACGENGDYLGTLEVTQDIGPIQAIEGEERLMS